MVSVRPHQPRDREKLDQLIGQRGNARILVAEEDGQVVGAAVWQDAGDGNAELGYVATTTPDRRDVFYAVVRGVAREMLAEGFTRGHFTIGDPALLDRIQRDFFVLPIPTGWDPITHESSQWRVNVNLADAVKQLDAALARLERRA